jgi:hypothetical protein
MATQPMSEEMLRYFMQLNTAEQKSVLQMIKTFLMGRKGDTNADTLQEYNEELERNDAEIEAGDYVPHKEVMNRYLKS